MLDAGERRCVALIEGAGVSDDVDDSWLKRFGCKPARGVLQRVGAAGRRQVAPRTRGTRYARALQARAALFFRSGETLVAVGDDDLAALKIPMQSSSSIARVWRDQRAVTIEEDAGRLWSIVRSCGGSTDRMYVAAQRRRVAGRRAGVSFERRSPAEAVLR